MKTASPTEPQTFALLDEARRVTERVCAEVRTAQRVWAHFEAINGETRDPLMRGVYRVDVGYPFDTLRKTISRDALMALFRATDGEGRNKDLMTLCRLSSLLQSEELRENRRAAAREWIKSPFPELAEIDAANVSSWMQAITDAFTPSWSDAWLPVDRCVFDLRERLKPLRDGTLAHAMENDGNVVVDEIRSFLKMATQFAQHAQLVFLEQAQSWTADWRWHLKRTNEFWDRCQVGFEIKLPRDQDRDV